MDRRSLARFWKLEVCTAYLNTPYIVGCGNTDLVCHLGDRAVVQVRSGQRRHIAGEHQALRRLRETFIDLWNRFLKALTVLMLKRYNHPIRGGLCYCVPGLLIVRLDQGRVHWSQSQTWCLGRHAWTDL